MYFSIWFCSLTMTMIDEISFVSIRVSHSSPRLRLGRKKGENIFKKGSQSDNRTTVDFFFFIFSRPNVEYCCINSHIDSHIIEFVIICYHPETISSQQKQYVYKKKCKKKNMPQSSLQQPNRIER